MLNYFKDFNKETKKEAVKRLKKEGHGKLYIVDCHITDLTAMASTWLWNIYENKDDAKRWIKLCKMYVRTTNYTYQENFFGNAYTYTTLDSDPHEMREEFVMTVV